MSTAALSEAKYWADSLLNHEFKGRGDKEKSVRHRLSKRIGIPESYLFRLQYKTAEMKDVAGSVYRALMLEYDRICSVNEAAAARYKTEREHLKAGNAQADEEHLEEGL